ncbi:MAG: sulfotransferase [Phycisphaerales bacterium]|nr:sulfotransferase [Phycisphaerales bacterium]
MTARPHPEHDRAQAMHAERLVMSGQFLQAIPLFRDLLRRHPNHGPAAYMLGLCETATARREEGRKHLELAIRLGPVVPAMYYNLALAFRGMAKFDEAHAAQDTIIARWPDDPIGPAGKADLYHFQGRTADAMAALEPALVRHPGDLALALAFGRVCVEAGQAERGAALLGPHAARTDLSSGQRAQVLFRFAPILEKLGRFDEAWQAGAAANAIRREPWDAGAHAQQIDRMIASWSPDRLRGLKPSRHAAALPVFIVGFPRSGTSLVEQIIASHPQAAGAGELPDMHDLVRESCGSWYMENPEKLPKGAFDRLGERYLRELRRIAPGAQRVTDKAPMNWRCLGPIALMLPGARIIHCVRSPMGTCVSCWFLAFDGAMPFVYDQQALGTMYRHYRRLAEHWRGVLADASPGVGFLEVRYEDLVADPETHTRRLIDFVGLPWDEACLRFHENARVMTTASNQQVRKPVYRTSVARWTRYEKHLGPLRAALGPLASERA